MKYTSLSSTSFNRNNSIDLFRYLCAFMVVIIHSSFWKNWGAFGFFVGNIFVRIAVPFFFAVSGYFYIKKLIAGEKVFCKQLKHILCVYTIWSSVYFLLEFFNQVILDGKGMIPVLKNFIISFLLFGSVEHFWFFPALIISLCLVTVIYKCGLIKILIPTSVVLYILGCMCCSYFGLARHIPVLGNLFEQDWFNTIRRIFLMGFPFFSVGYLLSVIESRKKTSNKKLFVLWVISALFFMTEILLLLYFKIPLNIILTVGLYVLLITTMLLLLNNPLSKYGKSAKIARTIANFTYYSHPLFQTFMVLFSKYTGFIIPNLVVFIFTITITFVLGLISYLIVEKKDCKVVKMIVG